MRSLRLCVCRNSMSSPAALAGAASQVAATILELEHQQERAFQYSRASPAVRWPTTHQEHAEDLDEVAGPRNDAAIKPFSNSALVLDCRKGKEFQRRSAPSSFSVGQQRGGVDGEDGEERGRKRGLRTRKLSKLALRRAKDWKARVERLSETICELELEKPVAEVLEGWVEQLSPDDLCCVVKTVGGTHWERALELYEWLNLRRWYTPIPRMLASILGVLGRSNQVALAAELFYRAEPELTNCVQVYNAMLSVHARHGQWHKLEALIDRMHQKGCEPDIFTFNIIANARMKSGLQPGMASSLLHQIRSAGLRPDAVTYNTLIGACITNQSFVEAREIFQEMKQNGCEPDLWTYNTMISVYRRSGLDKAAGEVLADLQSSGLAPDAITSSLFRYESVKNDRLKDATGSVDKMVAAINSNGEVIHISMNEILDKERQQEEALGLYDQMREERCTSDAITSTDLSGSFGKDNLAEEDPNKQTEAISKPSFCRVSLMLTDYARGGAYVQNGNVSNSLSSLRVQPDHRPYFMLDLSQKAGELGEAFSLDETAVQDDMEPQPHASAEGGFLGLHKERGMFLQRTKNGILSRFEPGALDPTSIRARYQGVPAVDHSKSLLKWQPSFQMHNCSIELGVDSRRDRYINMLQHFLIIGDISEVKSVYQELRAAKVVLHMRIYISLLGFFSRKGKVQDAETIVQNMEEAGYKPSVVVYNILMSLYCRMGTFWKVCNIYQGMQAVGCEPDSATYSTLITMYSKNLMTLEAVTVLRRMFHAGYFPDATFYDSLMSLYGRLYMWEAAEELLLVMKESGTKLSGSTYHAMINVYRRSGKYKEAEKLVTEMGLQGIKPTAVTLHMLMDSAARGGELAKAEIIFEGLRGTGGSANVGHYTSLIYAYLNNQDYLSGMKMLIKMKEAGLEPSYITWTCVIGASSHCEKRSDMLMLLAALRDTGCPLPLRLLLEKKESVMLEVESWLTHLQASTDDGGQGLVNVLEDLLWAFQQRGTADRLFKLAVRVGVYQESYSRVHEKDWEADFRKLSPGTALIAMTQWLTQMQYASLEGFPESPKEVALITGGCKHSNQVSLNKTIKAHLWEMGSPFLTRPPRDGALLAKGHSLRMWLKESPHCVDMELKDITPLPSLNSMQVYNGAWMRAKMVPVMQQIEASMGNVRPKKYSKLARMASEKRAEVIAAHLKGREEKLAKLRSKHKGVSRTMIRR